MSATSTTPSPAPLQPHIESRILALREQRVMLDADLAVLYGVETRVLIQAVKRNLSRFPEDFMFQLSTEEFANLRSQTVTSRWGRNRVEPARAASTSWLTSRAALFGVRNRPWPAG